MSWGKDGWQDRGRESSRGEVGRGKGCNEGVKIKHNGRLVGGWMREGKPLLVLMTGTSTDTTSHTQAMSHLLSQTCTILRG